SRVAHPARVFSKLRIWLPGSIVAAVVAGTLAACGDDSIKTAGLVALDGRTGAVLWSRGTRAAILGHPSEEGRQVVMIGQYPIPGAGDETWRWIAFDRDSGEPVKRTSHRKLPGPPVHVALSGGMNIRSVGPNGLEGRSSDGRVRWRTTLRRTPIGPN